MTINKVGGLGPLTVIKMSESLGLMAPLVFNGEDHKDVLEEGVDA